MNIVYPTAVTATEVQEFGNHNAKMYPDTGRHMGIDIAAKVGTPIYAVCRGVVSTVSPVNAYGYGRHVIIEHGGFRTLYAHLHRLDVRVGDAVEASHQLGLMGGDPKDKDKIDGASGGPHLHFEVILGNQPKGDFVQTVLGWTVDPFKYLLDNFAPPPIWIGTVTEKSGLRVRSTPDMKDATNVLRALQNKDVVELAELLLPNGSSWARIRALRQEWVCIKYLSASFVTLSPFVPLLPFVPSVSVDIKPRDIEKETRRAEVELLITFLENRKNELK